MDKSATDDAQKVGRPIASLISKSERAAQKLAPGTWQHRRLGDDLSALRTGLTLVDKETSDTGCFTPAELQEALDALARMISRTDEAQSKLVPGTSHYTLLRDRLTALRVAEAGIKLRLRDGTG